MAPSCNHRIEATPLRSFDDPSDTRQLENPIVDVQVRDFDACVVVKPPLSLQKETPLVIKLTAVGHRPVAPRVLVCPNDKPIVKVGIAGSHLRVDVHSPHQVSLVGPYRPNFRPPIPKTLREAVPSSCGHARKHPAAVHWSGEPSLPPVGLAFGLARRSIGRH